MNLKFGFGYLKTLDHSRKKKIFEIRILEGDWFDR